MEKIYRYLDSITIVRMEDNPDPEEVRKAREELRHAIEIGWTAILGVPVEVKEIDPVKEKPA